MASMENLQGTKILFVITKSNWGGAQKYVYTLATKSSAAGAEVVVALGGTGGTGAAPGRLAEELQKSGIRTIFVRNFIRDIGYLHEYKALGELLRIFRQERPHTLHLNSSKAGGIGALAGRLAGIPNIVFTSHGLAYDENRNLFSRLLIWLSTWATVLLTHRTIVISKDTYTRARRLPFCTEKIRLMYNGIAAIDFKPRMEAREMLAKGVPQNLPWIGTISELTRNKGLSYLVEAAALLKERGLPFHLCIIGVGEELPILRKLIEKNKLSEEVSIVGFVPEAAQYVTAFNIFTLTSVKEGLPYVLLEAGQAKCAVVGSRIPGIIDIIDDTTGRLVEPKNLRAIADALEALLQNAEQCQALGDKLHARVIEEFSIENMMKEITKIYRS